MTSYYFSKIKEQSIRRLYLPECHQLAEPHEGRVLLVRQARQGGGHLVCQQGLLTAHEVLKLCFIGALPCPALEVDPAQLDGHGDAVLVEHSSPNSAVGFLEEIGQ